MGFFLNKTLPIRESTNVRREGTLFKAKGNPVPEAQKLTTDEARTLFGHTNKLQLH